MSTKKIYLFCDAGMSTSIMVNKMMEVVKKHNMPLEISAYPVARTKEIVEKERPIAIVLGPQVRFLLDKTKNEYEPQGIPVSSIDPEAYGMMDGEKALKEVLKVVKTFKKD